MSKSLSSVACHPVDGAPPGAGVTPVPSAPVPSAPAPFVPSLKSIDTLSAYPVGTSWADQFITADVVQTESMNYARGITEIDNAQFASGDRSYKCTSVTSDARFGVHSYYSPISVQGKTLTLQMKTYFPAGFDFTTTPNDQWKFIRTRRADNLAVNMGDFDILYEEKNPTQPFSTSSTGRFTFQDTRNPGFHSPIWGENHVIRGDDPGQPGIWNAMQPDMWQTWTLQIYFSTTVGTVKFWCHSPSGPNTGTILLLDTPAWDNLLTTSDTAEGVWLCDYWNGLAPGNHSMWTDSWYLTDEAVSPFPFSGGFPVVL